MGGTLCHPRSGAKRSPHLGCSPRPGWVLPLGQPDPLPDPHPLPLAGCGLVVRILRHAVLIRQMTPRESSSGKLLGPHRCVGLGTEGPRWEDGGLRVHVCRPDTPFVTRRSPGSPGSGVLWGWGVLGLGGPHPATQGWKGLPWCCQQSRLPVRAEGHLGEVTTRYDVTTRCDITAAGL